MWCDNDGVLKRLIHVVYNMVYTGDKLNVLDGLIHFTTAKT